MPEPTAGFLLTVIDKSLLAPAGNLLSSPFLRSTSKVTDPCQIHTVSYRFIMHFQLLRFHIQSESKKETFKGLVFPQINTLNLKCNHAHVNTEHLRASITGVFSVHYDDCFGCNCNTFRNIVSQLSSAMASRSTPFIPFRTAAVSLAF